MFDETLIMKNFALDEIVFVMPAYRLGIFGFMNLGYHDRSDAPLNAGILDLISALRWTQLEAHNFGGDSRQITVVGNSDGANLALILINSPLVEPMAFKSAIISSGMFEISKGQSRQMSEEVLEQVGVCFIK
jgi:carboxylesterase type B